MQVIQVFIEKILRKHGVDSTKDFYLKLSMPSHFDLVIERIEELILVGHYQDETADIGDPIFVFDFNGGKWYPLGLKQPSGDTVVSYFENGKRMVNPVTIKQFWLLQKGFTRKIRQQEWFENGVKVQTGLICEVMFIEKGSPNPMKDLSEYSNPDDEK